MCERRKEKDFEEFGPTRMIGQTLKALTQWFGAIKTSLTSLTSLGEQCEKKLLSSD